MKKSDSEKTRKKSRKKAEKAAPSSLRAMGIDNPSDIARYTLRKDGDEDVLRIYYKRARGSLLPDSKTFRLGRVHKTVVTDSGAPGYTDEKDISPILLAAITELDGIVKNAEDVADQKRAIIDEIDHLEEHLTARINDLRTQIARL